MKAYYYLAEAQMALNHPNEALSSALTAYEHCLKKGNASTSNISALILKAKKAKWEAGERERLRRQSELLRELEDRLETARQVEQGAIEADIRNGRLAWREGEEDLELVEQISRKKIEELQNVFGLANPLLLKRRVSCCTPIC